MKKKVIDHYDKISFYIRPNGTYEARFSINGKQISTYAKTKDDCLDKAKEKRKEMQEGTYKTPQRGISLTEYFNNWKIRKQSTIKGSTMYGYISSYKTNIEPYFGSRKIQTITRDEIFNWQAELGKTKKSKTVSIVKAVLHLVFKDALIDGLIAINPCDNVNNLSKGINEVSIQKTVHRALSDDEIELYERFANGEPLYYFFEFCKYSGCRCGEVAALLLTDIDEKNGLIHINKTVTRDSEDRVVVGTTKTDAGTRDLVLTPELKEVIERQKEVNTKLNVGTVKSLMLFSTIHGRYITASEINREIGRVVRRINNAGYEFERFTIHCTRDTYATRLTNLHCGYKVLQNILGHADIRTTLQRYAQVKNEDVKRELETIGNPYEKKGESNEQQIKTV